MGDGNFDVVGFEVFGLEVGDFQVREALWICNAERVGSRAPISTNMRDSPVSAYPLNSSCDLDMAV